jgi:hypothetical protein
LTQARIRWISTPPLREELARVLRRANYLDLTWNLISRKGVDAYNGKRVIPGLAN